MLFIFQRFVLSRFFISRTNMDAAKTRKKYFSRSDVKTLALSSLGGTLEFYDFIIFVFFAKYIGANFFPPHLSEFWQQINTYGTFAAGYLARPLGGIVMAHFGDKFGRKNMFMLSIVLMVIPTFAMAFVPTFETIGYGAPIFLLTVRVFQGIAIGGELPGAWVFVREHSQEAHKGAYIGLLTAAVVGGILLGSIVALFMNKLYAPAQLQEWAWRVPFFIGGVFGIFSIYIRRYLSETPTFLQMQSEQSIAKFPLKIVLKEAKTGVVISMLVTWMLTVCVVGMILLMPNFSVAITKYDVITNTYIQMAGIVFMCIGCVCAGCLSDHFGISNVCAFFSIGFAVVASFYFYNVYHLHNFYLLPAVYVLCCFFAGVMNFTPLIMTEIFPAKIRFSGLSFSYNISYAASGFVTPIIITALHKVSFEAQAGADLALKLTNAYYFITIPVLGLLCAFLVRNKM